MEYGVFCIPCSNAIMQGEHSWADERREIGWSTFPMLMAATSSEDCFNGGKKILEVLLTNTISTSRRIFQTSPIVSRPNYIACPDGRNNRPRLWRTRTSGGHLGMIRSQRCPAASCTDRILQSGTSKAAVVICGDHLLNVWITSDCGIQCGDAALREIHG